MSPFEGGLSVIFESSQEHGCESPVSSKVPKNKLDGNKGKSLG